MRSQSSSNGASHPRVSLGQDRGILVSKRFHTFFLDGYLYFKARLKLSLAAWWYKMAWRALIEQDVLRILRWSRNSSLMCPWRLFFELCPSIWRECMKPILNSFSSPFLWLRFSPQHQLCLQAGAGCQIAHGLPLAGEPQWTRMPQCVHCRYTMRRYACPRGGITHTGVKSCRSSWGWSLITVLCWIVTSHPLANCTKFALHAYLCLIVNKRARSQSLSSSSLVLVAACNLDWMHNFRSVQNCAQSPSLSIRCVLCKTTQYLFWWQRFCTKSHPCANCQCHAFA